MRAHRCRSGILLPCTTLALVVALLLPVPAPVRALQFDAAAVEQRARQAFGQRGEEAVSEWIALLQQYGSSPELEQVRAVNDFWNRTVRSGEDRDIWRETDYWATPLESLGK